MKKAYNYKFITYNPAMQKLTAKQEKFCQGIADGLNQTDAYKAAYNTSKMAVKTIWEYASRLADDSKVTARVAELREALAKKQLWTRERSVVILGNIAHGKSERSSDKVSAIKELNAMHGYNAPAKHEIAINPLVLVLNHGTKHSSV